MMRTCRFVKTGLYVASLFFEKARTAISYYGLAKARLKLLIV